MINGGSFWKVGASAEVRDAYPATLPIRRALEAIAWTLFDELSFSSKQRPELTTTELTMIASRLDARVVLMSLPPSIRGASVKRSIDGTTHRIGVDKDLPLPRLRFTIAHELGHLVVPHVAKAHGLILDGEATPDSPAWWRSALLTEVLANTFAAGLLVPRQVAVPHLIAHHWDPAVLVTEFGVTYETAAHRVVDLAPVDMHFLKVDHQRRITKAYAAYDLDLHANVMRVCGYFGSVRAIEEGHACRAANAPGEPGDPTFDQLSKAPGLDILCRTRVVQEQGKSVAITIGCREGDAEKLGWKLPEAKPVDIHMNCRAFCLRFRDKRCDKQESSAFEAFDGEVLDWYSRRDTSPTDRGEVLVLASEPHHDVVRHLRAVLANHHARLRWQSTPNPEVDAAVVVEAPAAVVWLTDADLDDPLEPVARRAFHRGEVFLCGTGPGRERRAPPDWLPSERYVPPPEDGQTTTFALNVFDHLRKLTW